MKGNKKALLDLVKFFGSQEAVADEFGCTQQAVSEWFKFGIPLKRAVEAERKTKGRITKERLRSDVFKAV